MIGFQSIVVVNFQLFQKNEYVTILKWKTSDPDVPLPYQHHPHIIVGPSSVLRRILPKLPQNLIFRKLNGPSSWIKIFMYFHIFKFWKLHQACSHVCPSWLTYQLFQKKKKLRPPEIKIQNFVFGSGQNFLSIVVSFNLFLSTTIDWMSFVVDKSPPSLSHIELHAWSSSSMALIHEYTHVRPKKFQKNNNNNFLKKLKYFVFRRGQTSSPLSPVIPHAWSLSSMTLIHEHTHIQPKKLQKNDNKKKKKIIEIFPLF